MDMKKFVAIDTGFKQGGVLFWDNGPVKWFRISAIDWQVLHEKICLFNAPLYIETLVLMPFHGKKTTLSNGRGYGRLEMMAILCDLDFTELHPKTWQTGLGIKRDGRKYKEHKEFLYQTAIDMFPEQAFSEEVADSFLMAKYISCNL